MTQKKVKYLKQLFVKEIFIGILKMRQVINPQLMFGQVDISAMKFDAKSRDDIPRILRGLQHIYVTANLREAIFNLLEQEVSPNVSKNNGRPGMELWSILVLGVLRLDLNCDYDRLHELCNNHKQLRQMLGHSDFYDETYYHMQSLKDNVSLLNEELLIKINEIIVNGGHLLAGKKSEEQVLHGRCDSFVVESNVHFPTDTNLLLDAMRKTLFLSADLCEKLNLSDLRQYKHNYRQLKHAQHKVQKSRRGKANEQKIIQAHKEYIKLCNEDVANVECVLTKILPNKQIEITKIILIDEIKGYISHAKRQIDQINRRVIHGEVIPHNEKVFSIFEPHTEWISKGKAGIPVELGLRVCVLEDQYQFILHHRVMEKETDDKVAVTMVKDCQKYFPKLKVVSFDKGFHSPSNQEQLLDILDTVALPRKGKLSVINQNIESSVEFRNARKKHAAVESAINALEVHGLDCCPDHGINGFRRYVALAVVARNLHRIGDILHKKEQKKLKCKARQLLNVGNNSTLRLVA